VKYTHREAGTTDAFFFTSAPFEGFVFLCICRSDIWVPRSLSMYMRMDDDTHSSRLGAQGPFRSFPSLSLVTSSSSAHARARTNERTNARGYFFSLRYHHVDAHRYASRARSRPRVPFERAHSRIRAFARECDLDVRGRARTRRGRRGDAREACVGCFFGGSRARTSSSRRRRRERTRGRRRAVDRTTTTRRPGGTSRVSI
jgi:hypothetical protein